MLAVETADLTNDFGRIAGLIFNGEKIIIPDSRNENLIILTEKEYNELDRLRQNEKYSSMLEKSRQELANGKTVTMTIEQLEEFAK